MMSEGFDLNPDGTITFEFDGITRVLKRPTMRQYRVAIEALGLAQEELTAKTADDESPLKIGLQFEVLLAWFDDLFTALAGEGLPHTADAIDEDKVPAWLISGEVVTSIVKHWQLVPSRHGGQ